MLMYYFLYINVFICSTIHYNNDKLKSTNLDLTFYIHKSLKVSNWYSKILQFQNKYPNHKFEIHQKWGYDLTNKLLPWLSHVAHMDDHTTRVFWYEAKRLITLSHTNLSNIVIWELQKNFHFHVKNHRK